MPNAQARRPAMLLCVLAFVLAGLAPSAAAAAVPSTSSAPYGTDGDVNAVATLGNTIYLGGLFSNVGLATGPGAALASSDGTADPTMPGISGGQVVAVVADGSGGWYIGGSFTHVG